MKDAALFLLDYLVENAQGEWVTSPSISPENLYRLPNGQQGTLCMGPSMDTQIIRALFHACLEAVEGRTEEDAFRERLEAALTRLPPHRIGRDGQLLEWAEDVEEVDLGHRHISHLFALFPGMTLPHSTRRKWRKRQGGRWRDGWRMAADTRDGAALGLFCSGPGWGCGAGVC